MQLPEEISTIILEFCDESVPILRLVCKEWRRLTWNRYVNSPYPITHDEWWIIADYSSGESLDVKRKLESAVGRILYSRTLRMPSIPVSMADIEMIPKAWLVRQLTSKEETESESSDNNGPLMVMNRGNIVGTVAGIERNYSDSDSEDEGWCTII